MRVLTVHGSRHVRLSVTIDPAVENLLSADAEVAGILEIFKYNLNRRGKSTDWSVHHLSKSNDSIVSDYFAKINNVLVKTRRF